MALPQQSFRPWTRVWSQFRGWSRTGHWEQALTVWRAAARESDGRAERTLSMIASVTLLARGASNGGFTFHDRGGPYGRAKGAKRVVAVDVTGLPLAALVVPASTHENRASELKLEHPGGQGVSDRLELALVDRGVTAAAARTLGGGHNVEVHRVGWDVKQPTFRPSGHAWRIEVAHGRLGRFRRLAKWFENTTTSATAWLQVVCVATALRHISESGAASVQRHSQPDRPLSRTARNAADECIYGSRQWTRQERSRAACCLPGRGARRRRPAADHGEGDRPRGRSGPTMSKAADTDQSSSRSSGQGG